MPLNLTELDSQADPLVQIDTSSTVYSLQGLVLKFDTLESIQPYLDQLEQVQDLQEVRFGGNTLGVEACQGVARVIEKKKGLKVSQLFHYSITLGQSKTYTGVYSSLCLTLASLEERKVLTK